MLSRICLFRKLCLTVIFGHVFFVWPYGMNIQPSGYYLFGPLVSAFQFQPSNHASVTLLVKIINTQIKRKEERKKTTKMYDKINFYLITYIKKFNWKYLLKYNFDHLLPLDLFLVGLFNGLIFNTSFFYQVASKPLIYGMNNWFYLDKYTKIQVLNV